ncbi:extracellular solute-binding protein [Ructibacterium gallinarum]|uniref:Extracellular solute-binding protein n=1 Tax=Ructibacterium gallinarum TaxID=2779355 RepID=A0A9D5LYW3_9FIRM|nr:extracellular solute-binding protein [Ructibacterium gallinarum]MBE5040561.1 extracellular solute-binding protein [Ructibacterium gallinarum]
MKTILALLGMAIITFSLSGCISKQKVTENANVEVITMLKPKGMSGIEQIVDKYEKMHNNVIIKIVEITDDTNEVYKTYTATLDRKDSDIDIYLIDEIWTEEFAKSGYLEPLGLELSGEKYEPKAIEMFTSEDTVYALPFAFDIGILFYRKDRVDKAPIHWGDVINGNPQPIFTMKEDEDLLCESIELGRYLKAAYPYFVEQGKDGCDNLKNRFKKGDINYYRGWSKEYAYFDDYDFEIGGNVGVMIPDMPVLGGYGFAISGFSENKKTARDFLAYMSDNRNIREMMKIERYIPVQKEFLTDKMFVDYNPCMREIENTIKRAVIRNSNDQYIKKAWALQKEIYTAICENKEPPEFKEIYIKEN